MEFELLSHLASEPSRVYSKQELLREVWFTALGNTRTVDAHACRLRKRLARAGAPHLIAKVRGASYRLRVGAPPGDRGPAVPTGVFGCALQTRHLSQSPYSG
jgi:DNA-binding response OmpR family regulator